MPAGEVDGFEISRGEKEIDLRKYRFSSVMYDDIEKAFHCKAVARFDDLTSFLIML
jgi:hypothetical protein